MGNSKSNTVTAKNPNLPIKPILKKQPVPGSVYGYYNQYPAGYIPEQSYYPYPANYPVVSSEQYPQNQFYPTTQSKTKAVEERIPTHYHGHRSAHPNHQSHHHHSPSRHSHHHHDHHPSPTSYPPLVIKEQVSPSRLNDSLTSAIPSLQRIPSVSAQKRIPTVVSYKIRSPLFNEQELSPTPPLRPPPSVVRQNSVVPVLTEKPTPPIGVTQYSSPPILLKSASPSLSTVPNSFEKAPMMAVHYVAKSTDDNSIPSYGPGPMTIVRRTASQSVTAGNRWYDHDFDKRVKPLVVENV